MTRARIAVTFVAALALAAGATPAAAITRGEAEKQALKILDPDHARGQIVVFGLKKAVARGKVLSEASPLSKPRPPEIIAQGHTRPPHFGPQKTSDPVELRRAAWVFWEDLAHGAAYEHGSRLLVLDRKTGNKVVDRWLSWWPELNGKSLPFVRDDAKGRVLYRNVPLSRRTVRAAQPDPLEPVAFAAALRLGGPDDCLFLIGDRTTEDHSARLFGNSLAAMGALATTSGLVTGQARTAKDLQNKIDAAIKKGCKDVMVFLAGHGSPPPGLADPLKPSETMAGTTLPTVSLGSFSLTAGAPKLNYNVTSQSFKNIMSWHPASVKFKIVIFSCFSGRFVDELKDDPHIKGGGVVTASSSASQYSWSYVQSGAPGADGFTKNVGELPNPVDDPRMLPGYVHGMITEIQKILDNPAAYSADDGSLAKIIHDAHIHSGAEDFTAQLGWTTPQDFHSPPPPTQPGPQPGPGTGTGDVTTGGSTMEPPADAFVKSQADQDIWSLIIKYCLDHPSDPNCKSYTPPSRQASSTNTRMPESGQILTIRVKGMAVPSGQNGDPGPETQIHFSNLRPQPDGSVKVIATSQAFFLPATGDPNQITSFYPQNLCVEAGDFLALSTLGGFDPTFYPDGVPFRVYGHVPGSSIGSFSEHNGVGNGAQFTGTAQNDTELLMQWDLGTGNQASALCPGGTRT